MAVEYIGASGGVTPTRFSFGVAALYSGYRFILQISIPDDPVALSLCIAVDLTLERSFDQPTIGRRVGVALRVEHQRPAVGAQAQMLAQRLQRR